MATSEARMLANKANAAKSCGPRTPEGKEHSRRNGLKHGMTGAGIVLTDEAASEVEILNEKLQAELNPQSSLGKIMVREMALLSVRMERGAQQETAAIAKRVRHAAEDFDKGRIVEAEGLMDLLGEEPRAHLRTLLGSPEGVECLIGAWTELRDALIQVPRPIWTAWHLERAVNLTGLRIEAAQGSSLAMLSKAAWGDFGSEAEDDDLDLDLELDARKARARASLLEQIDAEIASLEAHYETLDFDTIEIDRREAPDRALFDPSREATLARRYESEARRGFYKAGKELSRVEAEAVGRTQVVSTPESATSSAPLASSWQGPPPPRSLGPDVSRIASKVPDQVVKQPVGRLESTPKHPVGSP